MLNQFLLNADGSVPAGVDIDALQLAGVHLVIPTPPPQPAAGMVAIETSAVERDGRLYQSWAEAPAPLPEPAPMQLTHVEFMTTRFTRAELVAIYAAARNMVEVEVWLDIFRLSEYVDLSDPRTAAGIQNLEALGIIAAGRANEVLSK